MLTTDQQGNLWAGDTLQYGQLNKPFWAKILSYDGTTFYSWEEWVPAAVAGFQFLNGGRSGTTSVTPAYAPNGEVIAINSIVRMVRAYFNPTTDWVYAVESATGAGASSLEVKTTNPGSGDSPVDVTGVSVVRVDQASGLQLVDNTGGVVTVSAQAASATHAGAVSLTNQTLGAGDKTFTSGHLFFTESDDTSNSIGSGFVDNIWRGNVGGLVQQVMYRANVFGFDGQFGGGLSIYTITSGGASVGSTRVAAVRANPADIATATVRFSIETASIGGTGGPGTLVDGIDTTATAGDGATLTFTGGIITGNVGGGNAPAFTNVPQTFTAKQKVKAGTGGGTAAVGGTLFDHFADANNSGTVETDLYSDTIPGNTFATNGDKLVYYAGGTFTGAVSATQQFRAYFGGTLVFDSGAVSLGATTVNWEFSAFLIRESSSVVRVVASLSGLTSTLLAADSQYTRVTGLTLSSNQVVKITGTAGGIGGGSNQITASLASGWWYPAA